MVMVQERSALGGLEARRVTLRRELFQVNRRINRRIRQAEQEQARLEERIKVLEKEQRLAA